MSGGKVTKTAEEIVKEVILLSYSHKDGGEYILREMPKALKLYALKQMEPMVDAIKKAGRCPECGGTLKTNKTEKCIAMWQVDCWKCRLSGLESWAVEALAHHTRLKEEMNERS